MEEADTNITALGAATGKAHTQQWKDWLPRSASHVRHRGARFACAFSHLFLMVPPVGKDDERAYENTEKGLSAEGMSELGCSSDKVIAMQGAAGVFLVEGSPQVGDDWRGRGLGVSGWQRKQ